MIIISTLIRKDIYALAYSSGNLLYMRENTLLFVKKAYEIPYFVESRCGKKLYSWLIPVAKYLDHLVKKCFRIRTW